jgi:hypothetical protein
VWEVLEVEVSEEVRGNLRAQVIDVRCCDHRVEWCPVDQFEGPGPYSHDDIVASQLIPPPNERAKPNMSERAPDVCVHLDHSHVLDPTPAESVEPRSCLRVQVRGCKDAICQEPTSW